MPELMILGIDGATWGVLDDLLARGGELPCIQRLVSEGVRGDLRSTVPPTTLPAWTSMTTGKNPGKHGRFDFTRRDDEGYGFVPAPNRIDSNNLFLYLSRIGYSVGAINVPGTYPPPEVDGFVVSGMMTPSYEHDYTYPRELKEELNEMGYRIQPKEIIGEGKEASLEPELFRTIEVRQEVNRMLLDRYSPDVFMTVFQSVDHGQHLFWKHHDEDHPDHDPEKAERFGGVIEECYRRVDACIGQLMDEYPEAEVLVVSDHGFGQLRGNVYLNEFLEERDRLSLDSSPVVALKRAAARLGWKPKALYDAATRLGLSNIGRRIPDSDSRNRLKKVLKKSVEKGFINYEDIDWDRTTAYSGGYWGQVFLNLEGREPDGTVPRDRYGGVLGTLIEELESMEYPETGESVDVQAHAGRDLYTGRYADEGPDIVVTVEDGAYISHGTFSFGMGDYLQDTIGGKSGSHRMEGVFMYGGNHSDPGVELDSPHITSVYPTILHILDAPIPSDVDGEVLRDAFRKGSKPFERDATYRDIRSETDESTLDSDERDEVRENLSNLGYL